MYITKKSDPFATLMEDREGPTTIDGSATLLFTRRKYGMYLRGVDGLDIRNFSVFRLAEASRGKRFLKAIPALWRFCK